MARYERGTFFGDTTDRLLRALWFASKVSDRIVLRFTPESMVFALGDDSFVEEDRERLWEAVGYTVSFALNRLRDDIEETEGWTDETHDLHISYVVFIAKAFDDVFGLARRGESFFLERFRDYYAPSYDEEYERFWGIEEESLDEPMSMTVEELVQEATSPRRADDQEYNVDRYYVYRLSKLVNVADRTKVLSNVRRRYADVALAFYLDAFVGLDRTRILEGLGRMRDGDSLFSGLDRLE